MIKIERKIPKQSRSQETVESIYQAVARIFDHQGAQGLNTNRIAEVAGVSIGSLYQYFKNKESIFQAMIMTLLESNLKKLEVIIATPRSEPLTLRQMVELIVKEQFDSFMRLGPMAQFLLQYAPKLVPLSHFKQVDERIIQFLKQQQQELGLVLRIADPEVGYFLCSQLLRSTLLMTFSTKESKDYMVIQQELVDMIVRYLQ